MEVDIQLFCCVDLPTTTTTMYLGGLIPYLLQQYDLIQLIEMRGLKQAKTIHGVRCSDTNSAYCSTIQ